MGEKMDLSDAVAGFLVIVGLALLVVGALFVFALLGTIMGLFTGWVISVTPLGSFVEQGFKTFGFNAEGLLPHIGATLGFVGGFIRGMIQIKHEKDD